MKKLYLITLLLAMMTSVMAQSPHIRYVKKGGAYANTGKSWGQAKNNIQDAINDLVDNGLTGEVWVAAGTYTPTESTEQSGGSTLYMAFKIPAGITVRGGFEGTESTAAAREKVTSKLMGENGMFKYKTILSGRLASTPETFTFDDQKQVFTPKFYGNTYHVVWFAMNGFDTDGRAKALTGGKAVLEGCIIEGGHANNNDLNGRKHNAYGGGIYMVDGAVVQDCEIRHCDASRDGGGVYMDGGGLLKHSYIHDCQALGVGTDSGFGGGVCLEGLKDASSTMNVIMQSVVSNNVGRFGGGLAMKVNNTANRTKLAASSVLVNNNTATTSTGGVFLYKGGAISGLTIVRNRCNGSGVYTNGIQSGRAGGLFAYDKANIANTVIWGNQCDANNDIQYASERSRNDNTLKPDMKFCSLSRADLCDWSGTVKTSVRSLHDANRETDDKKVDHSMGYALFENPTIKAGYVPALGEKNYGNKTAESDTWDVAGQYDTGKKDDEDHAIMADYAEKSAQPINWEVFSESALHHAGIQNIDIDKEGETESPLETFDIRNKQFNPRVTLGAYVAPAANIHPDALTNPSEVNFYVDPNHVFGHHTGTDLGNGHSWDEPTRYLANVLKLIKDDKVYDRNGTKINLSERTINIYIKEGTINNTNSYEKNKRVRNVAIEVPSNVNIYGGYPAENTVQSLEGRNPRLHQTIISGEIMGDFMTNVSHLVTLTDASNVLIDGVQIRNANATSDLLGAEGRDGAALTIKGGSGIVFKNVLVANNAAHKGAAVYAENTTASFENCIFHNNTSSSELKTNGLLADGNPTAVNGIIYSTGTAKLTFNHCDVLRNVGYASVHEGSKTNTWNNTVFYGNLSKAVENTNTATGTNLHANALPAFSGSGATRVEGANCMFDAKSASFKTIFKDEHSKFDLSYDLNETANYPRFINPTRNSGHSIGGDVTFYGRSTSFEPHNLNPMVNAASHEGAHTSWGKDMSDVITRDFGGLPDIGAIENHQDTIKVWENSYTEGQAAYGTIYYVRDYATTDGTPNVVTKDFVDGKYVENEHGKGKYNANNELFDGSSWEYAINGNANYDARIVQLPTFTLSFVDHNDGDKVKYLGYEVTKHNRNQLFDDEGNAIVDEYGNPVYEQVDSILMHQHLKYPASNYSNWFSMEITEKPSEAIHFEVNSSGHLTFTVNGPRTNGAAIQNNVTYGLGYGTADGIRNLAFLPNYNGGDPFVYDETNKWCKSGGFYYCFKEYGTGGDAKLLLATTTNSTDAVQFIRTFDKDTIPARGLQWAVDNAKVNGVKAVRVAAGTYTNHNERNAHSNDQDYAFMMEEGVNVLGGYPKSGNPGEEERQPKENITNLQIQDEVPTWKSEDVMSSLLKDGSTSGDHKGHASIGRVLVQPVNFAVETKWDGFTIRNGFLHSWYRHNIRGNISTIRTNLIGTSGGAGAYLMGNGVLENCVIKDNVILVVPIYDSDDNHTGYQAVNSPTSDGGFHQAGAGVYMTGTDVLRGTIKNCDINNNQLIHKYWKRSNSGHPESSWMYGAGLYLDNGIVYNTVIHNNMMRVIQGNQTNNNGSDQVNEVLVGAGAFLVRGEFYNNTVVNNEAHTFAKQHNRNIAMPGVYVYNNMAMYNSIVAGNTSSHFNESTGNTQKFGVPVCSFSNNDRYDYVPGNVTVKYSYIDVADNVETNLCKLNDDVIENEELKSRTNIYLNSKAGGNYDLSEILNVDGTNKYRLIDSSPCFNAGTESIPNSAKRPDSPSGGDSGSGDSEWDDWITIPTEDADYTFRVKDCRIDIGAFEFNGAVGIFPQEFDASGNVTDDAANVKQAVYYVTPNGYGTRAANDPENAACAQKLQKVIDAAGRYKYEHPTVNVVVKVANSYDYLHPNNGTKEPTDPTYVKPDNFKYYATRSTNKADENVRVWSIIIPRGVEVWGGYSDVTLRYNDKGKIELDGDGNLQVKKDSQDKRVWSNEDNGFYGRSGDGEEVPYTFTSRRDITKTPTYFDSYYENKLEHSTANCYHVVTFSDRVFDPEGNPYKNGEAGKVASGDLSLYDPMQDRAEELFLHMSGVINTETAGIENTNLHRAVLDGIFVTGGKADAQGAGESTSLNINQYGGAAIVTDYAHVRNCILKNNVANNGGALALTHKAIVSGTLMVENTANQNGGALYIFEEDATLSDGTVIKSQNNGSAPGEYSNRMDLNMARVITSTVVGNSAPKGSGGGIWFTENKTPNVRVISSVFWNNTALDQANVFGMISPEKLTTDQYSAEEFYPFAYSAIQNIRASGTNNFSVDQINSKGVRFANTDTDGKIVPVLDEDLNANRNISPLYGLIGYSTLTHTGMPVKDYQKVVDNLAVAPADYMGVSRTVNTSTVPRTYVEVGARAINKAYSRTQPMYRLFVAKPDEVDMAAAKAMMTSDNDYYKQEGSSFAYPFQSLQDALDYIHLMRYSGTNGLLNDHGANNLPFEICVSGGIYHPKRDLVGNTDHALSATFAIPEGVSVYGGFNCRIARDDHDQPIEKAFYGKGFETVNETAAKSKSTAPATTDPAIDINSFVEKVAADKDTIVIGDFKIIERPNDYILSRRARVDLNANNIIEPWEFADQTIFSGDASNAANNGVYHVMTVVPDENIVGTLPVANKTYKALGTEENADKFGMEAHMMGQQINIDGIQIQGGYAYHYVTDAFDDDQTSDYNYYHGGGILIDGNRYCDVKYGGSDPAPANPEGKTGVVTYKHTGRTNAVGYRDIPVNIKNCKFLDNRGGFGGAISSNTTLNIFQSSFEQNMAVRMQETFMHNSTPEDDGSTVTVEYPGNGGAIHSTYRLHAFNTLFANNEAVNSTYSITPKYYHTLRNERESTGTQGLAIQGGAGGAISVGKVGIFHIINCNFVKNKANMYPAVFTMNPNYSMADGTDYTQYSKFANTVFWGNEVNENMPTSNGIFNFASKLICNYGRANRNGAAYDPAFTESNAPDKQSALDANYQETAWFCAYEDGRGKTANHNEDMRDYDYSPLTHVENIFKTAGVDGVKQNCNIIISEENNVLEGPNFVNPSHDAGVAGYMESADWSPARINNLTDNGSGKIMQTISLNETTQKYANTYNTYTSAPEGRDYSNETTGDYITSGIYTTNHYLKASPQFRDQISLGDARPYMRYVQGNEDIYRISFDPNPTHDHTYVDIGVYEYVHVQLRPVGDEVDVLWVSTDEKPENGVADGSSWAQPTSDLQRAIETLLASRNGHRKEVRLMDGTFTPTYTINNNLGFCIDTYKLNGNVILPLNDGGTGPVYDLGVKSLTIKGGYSKDLEGEYDVERYPAIIKGQQRTDNGTSDRWDHAFYIYDATQRYGASAYNVGNNYGATKDGQAAIQTIPIEVDGITFINDQAKPNVSGSALYYDAQTEKDHLDGVRIGATTGTSNGTGQKITYYTTDAKSEVSPTPTEFFTEENVSISAPAALIISKCKFYGSGSYKDAAGTATDAEKGTTSAVYVGTKGHIKSLIYNNVFHSNYGKPLEAYNATTINNTYGLNGSYIDLKNEGAGGTSSILNSAMWRNNPTAEGGVYDVQAKIGDISYGGKDAAAEPTSGGMSTVFNYNAFTMKAASNVNPVDNVNKNASLSNDNSDLFNGPNFIDPENAVVEKRNFNLMPSFRLLNTGLNTNYDRNLVEVTAATAETPAVCTGTIYDLAQYSTVDYDAALNTRKIGTAIDLGAYEYQNEFQRIFYVDPTSMKADADGKSWEKALGNRQIQDAINMAALYSKANSNKEAYVYVKGASLTNKGFHTEETLTPRNGVKVYGGIAASYNAEHDGNEADDAVATAYEQKVVNDRMGVAEPLGNKTTIAGIKTSPATDFSGVTVIDGFDVTATTNDNAEGVITEPIINIAPNPNEGSATVKQFALRNLIVRDNKLTTADQNLVNIDKALIYEVLMRDNNVTDGAAVMHLGANGWAVNVTVEGKSTYTNSGTQVTPLNGGNTSSTETSCHTINSLVNYGSDAATANTLSGYNYELEDKNLNYQLTEMSKHIDGCATPDAPGTGETLSPLNGITAAASLAGFIDYAHDRDLLGNPRMMYLASPSSSSYIDRGAFETWKVNKTEVRTDAGSVTTVDDVTTVAATPHDGWTGIHYYPHAGSVVYIMEGNNLMLDGDGTTDNAEYHPYDLTPGFLLVQKGASLYANDKKVNAAYVAVERDIKKDGSIVALPYAMKYKLSTENAKNIGAAAPAYSKDVADKGVLSFSDATAYAYNYSGSKRSAWDYIFARKDESATSDCWIELTSADDVTEANNGVLYEASGFGESGTEKLVRFTAKGENMADYIYTENGVSKTVLLKKYDDTESANHDASFTDPLDMGWNCFGIPYLVSEYKPYEKVTANAGANTVVKDDEHGTYSMSRAHTLWLYYDGVHTPDFDAEHDAADAKKVDGDGGYYSVKSWESSNATTDAEFADGDHTNPWHVTSLNQQTIWVGEGIFTQTATLDDTESLVFYRPIYTGSGSTLAKAVRYYGSPTGIEEVTEDVNTDNVELVGTEYYTTDGMQIREPRRGSIVIIKRIYSNGAVKATKQYVK